MNIGEYKKRVAKREAGHFCTEAERRYDMDNYGEVYGRPPAKDYKLSTNFNKKEINWMKQAIAKVGAAHYFTILFKAFSANGRELGGFVALWRKDNTPTGVESNVWAEFERIKEANKPTPPPKYRTIETRWGEKIYVVIS